MRAQKVESIPTVEKIYRKLTLKAFANSSPGLSFGNPGENPSHFKGATLKELGRRLLTAKPRNPFRVANNLPGHLCTQGFKANPGLTVANAFSVTRFLHASEFSTLPGDLKQTRPQTPSNCSGRNSRKSLCSCRDKCCSAHSPDLGTGRLHVRSRRCIWLVYRRACAPTTRTVHRSPTYKNGNRGRATSPSRWSSRLAGSHLSNRPNANRRCSRRK